MMRQEKKNYSDIQFCNVTLEAVFICKDTVQIFMKITYVSDRFVWKHPSEILPFFESMEIFKRERERERERFVKVEYCTVDTVLWITSVLVLILSLILRLMVHKINKMIDTNKSYEFILCNSHIQLPEADLRLLQHPRWSAL